MRAQNANSGSKGKHWIRHVIDQVDNAFVSTIPIEAIKAFPGKSKYALGLLAQLCAGALFGYFVYSGYLNGIESQFISLDPSNGVCSHVTKVITGSFMVSSRGYWEGHANFDYSEAFMELQLSNLRVTAAELNQYLLSLTQQFQMFNSISSGQDLCTNLIWLMTFTSYAVVGEWVQNFRFMADPRYVFLRHFTYFAANPPLPS